jgi:Thioesterase-like superfamily
MSIVSLPSWPKTLLFIYLIANLKALPFAWHIRLLYQLIANISRTPIPPKPLLSTSADSPNRRILTHPLFTSAEISTHTPLLETDYNLHKSNSTYLSDIDISRTKLVTRLFSPGFRKLNIQLQDEGYAGRMIVALGGVHMSFRQEIAIYERVRIRSRVLTWDGKWLVIVSCFLREGEILCAVGLSRYVLKKGRFTVRPERVLRAAGWLPEKFGEEEPEKSEKANGREGAESAFAAIKRESSPSLADKGEGGLSREHAVEGLKSPQNPELQKR